MLKLTKIFHFETAHAIHGYKGSCKNLHGHSYELHVTVVADTNESTYIPPPGFVIDFKEIKELVNACIIHKFDHCVLLSADFIAANPSFSSLENLLLFEAEPTAENMLLYMKRELATRLPENIKLSRLKLFETKNSYAEWTSGDS